MDNKVQLISDGDGLTVIGDRTDVELFLASEGLWSVSKAFDLSRLAPILRTVAGLAQAASEISANSARWLKLTEESAQLVKKLGLTEGKTPGVTYAMVGKRGSIASWLRIEKGPGSFLTNPSVLSGAAGMMSQLATQHEMNEIKSYLKRIDKKADDILQAQKDAELAKVFGAGLDIGSAMTSLERMRRVDDDTWSTVQGRTHTITDALGWALARLDALADKVGSAASIGDLAKVAKAAESEVQELLTVVARCFELQDAIDVLRLDRVLEKSPDELDARRLALKDDRQKRRELITQKIEHLMARMDAAAGTASSHVLLHLPTHRTLVGWINRVATALDDFHKPLGIDCGRPPLDATRWWDAARNPAQLKNAAAEAGRKAAIGAGAVAATAAAFVASRAALADEEGTGGK